MAIKTFEVVLIWPGSARSNSKICRVCRRCLVSFLDSQNVSIQYSVMVIRGNGVTLRTQKVIQGGDNGHVGRPCEVSLAPPCPELFCELRGLCRRSYFGPRTCGRSEKTKVIEVAGSQSGFPKKPFSPLMSTGVQFLIWRGACSWSVISSGIKMLNRFILTSACSLVWNFDRDLAQSRVEFCSKGRIVSFLLANARRRTNTLIAWYKCDLWINLLVQITKSFGTDLRH